MNDGINLITKKTNTTAIVPTKKVQAMRLVALGVLFIVSASAITLFTLISLSPLPQLRKQEQSLKDSYGLYRAQIGKLALIDERVDSVDKLLKQSKQFDKLLATIQSNTGSDVKIASIRASNDAFEITVMSRSLNSLDKFLSNMTQVVKNKQGFTSITLNELATNDTSLTYQMSMTLGVL